MQPTQSTHLLSRLPRSRQPAAGYVHLSSVGQVARQPGEEAPAQDKATCRSTASGPASTLSLMLFALLLGGALIFVAPPAVQAQAQPCAQDAVVESGETLSVIAGRTLGSQQAYARIVEATNAQAEVDSSYAVIDDPNVIAVGWKLCIPSASTTDGGATDGGGIVSSNSASSAEASSSETSSSQDASSQSPASDAAAGPETAGGAAGVGAAQTEPPVAVDPEASVTTSVTGSTVITDDIFADRQEPGGPHPLSIDYLRGQMYPGSPITIQQTLAPGSNYSRYVVSYESEGLTINAYMTVPNGERPAQGWPVVVFNHGYIPPSVYRPTERYIEYTGGFARAGYIVLRPDYRGHAFSEGEPRGAYGDPGYTIDVLNALASIKQYPDADPNRIGMWGHSLGGFITARAMVVAEDIKAGVIWGGVVGTYEDMMRRWERDRPWTPPPDMPRRRWRETLTEEYGSPEENPDFWATISTNSYVADLSGPVQLHHGMDDGEVPVLFSEVLHQDILDVDGYVEFYTYPGDNHNISNSFNTAMQRSVEFFDTYVKDLAAPPNTAEASSATAATEGTGAAE